MRTDTDLAVIGGGAAGMTAAICSARRNLRVTIIEHRDRVGKKILSTGNGRCNLGNVQVSPADYGGSTPAFVEEVISRCGNEELHRFFNSIGVPLVTEEDRIYPRTMQAQTVTDALRFEIARLGIRTMTQTEILSAEKRGDSFSIRIKEGKTLSAGTLLMAPGGLAAPKSGSDGSANTLITAFGHTIRPQLPALVPLVTDAAYRRALSGLRLNGGVSLFVDGKEVQSEIGQIQFTDYGVSGIPVFQLSAAASEALRDRKHVQVCLDLLPEQTAEEIAGELLRRLQMFREDDMQTLLNGFLPKKMVNVLCRLCDIRPSASPRDLFSEKGSADASPLRQLPAQMQEMACLCKRLYQTVTGTRGFDMAQTTSGGVPENELTASMASRLVPGLFFAGEVVNVHGRCGGCNLTWAWASGMAAGNGAADYIGR